MWTEYFSVYRFVCVFLIVVRWLTKTCSSTKKKKLLYTWKCSLRVYRGILFNKDMAEMNFKCIPYSSLDGHRKSTKDIRKNTWCSASNLNSASPRDEVFYFRCKVQLFASSLLSYTKFTTNETCNCPAILSNDSCISYNGCHY
jgi:hypothetical protein